MEFEYDSEKSVQNKRKQGIDFEEAQALWLDTELVEIPARTLDEPRWLLIGKIGARRYPSMKAKIFDRKFDSGQSVVNQLNLNKARRMNTDPKRVNVDFPAWMVDSLDREARRLGVTRQSLIKLWLADRLSQPVSAGNR